MTGKRNFDQLLKVDGHYFLASGVICIGVATDPLCVTIKFSPGCEIVLTDPEQIQSFRAQYTDYLKKNGI